MCKKASRGYTLWVTVLKGNRCWSRDFPEALSVMDYELLNLNNSTQKNNSILLQDLRIILFWEKYHSDVTARSITIIIMK